MNPRGSPGWVRSAHQTDQITCIFRHRRMPGLAMPDLPGPKKAKAIAVPSDHGFGLTPMSAEGQSAHTPHRQGGLEVMAYAQASSSQIRSRFTGGTGHLIECHGVTL
jgi:hypothetical protein